MAEDAKQTTVSHCTTIDGSYTAIGGLMGEPATPEVSHEVQKFQANDQVNPSLIVGDAEVSDVEVAIAYESYAAYAALAALAGTKQFIRFQLENLDWFTYYGVVAKVSPASASENGGHVGVIGFVFAYLAESFAAT